MQEKILVVDDEHTMLDVIRYSLEKAGYQVCTAQDGVEALRLAREQKPDLVVLDIMMPKLNGYEVCQRVKEDPDAGGIGIVLLTAKGQEVDRRQGLELGASRYMTKPFDPDEVLKVAKELLGLDP